MSMLQMQDTRIAGIAGDLCYQFVVAGQIQLGTNIVLTAIGPVPQQVDQFHSTYDKHTRNCTPLCSPELHIQMIEVHNCMMILLYNSLANA